MNVAHKYRKSAVGHTSMAMEWVMRWSKGRNKEHVKPVGRVRGGCMSRVAYCRMCKLGTAGGNVASINVCEETKSRNFEGHTL